MLVFAEGEGARNAEQAGADFVGSDDLIKRIEEGWTEFDVALASREMMSKVSRLGRVLGPRGLMPNPRTGTVVDPDDLAKAVNDSRQGRVEFRLDRTALIHVPIGKVSFEEDKLLENMATIVDAIVKAKPSGAKGQYIRSASLATTMGPGIQPGAGADAGDDQQPRPPGRKVEAEALMPRLPCIRRRYAFAIGVLCHATICQRPSCLAYAISTRGCGFTSRSPILTRALNLALISAVSPKARTSTSDMSIVR